MAFADTPDSSKHDFVKYHFNKPTWYQHLLPLHLQQLTTLSGATIATGSFGVWVSRDTGAKGVSLLLIRSACIKYHPSALANAYPKSPPLLLLSHLATCKPVHLLQLQLLATLLGKIPQHIRLLQHSLVILAAQWVLFSHFVHILTETASRVNISEH